MDSSAPDAPFTVAAVQAAPVFLDRETTTERACELIAEAGSTGARLVVFPEAFVPTYPLWVWFVPPGRTAVLRQLYAELVANAVSIPDATTERLCRAARSAGVHVVMGLNERNSEASGATLYNTLLYIDDTGEILGKHRKLVPTAGERLVHGRGGGDTLEVYETAIGRLGGLVCWENYMPLARYAIFAGGAQLYVAPTWDRGEPWISTLRHIAKEGRAYVIGCCSAVRRDDVPDRFDFKEGYLPDVEWLNPGDSAIVDPDGKFLAGPVRDEETILYAEIDPGDFRGPRFQLDVAGHYGRPDIFQLTVDRRPRPMMRSVEATPAPAPGDGDRAGPATDRGPAREGREIDAEGD